MTPDPVLVLHIVTASVAVIVGFVALYASKVATLHRRAGLVFVESMIAMGLTAGVVSITHDARPFAMVPAGALIACLVRVAREGPPVGVARIRRHVWRMGLALWIATMAWWLWRLRVRRSAPVPLGKEEAWSR